VIAIPLVPEGPWRELSPGAPAPFEIDGKRWPTATHYVLAHRYFFDKDHREVIRAAASPDEARELARRPGKYDFKGERTGTLDDPHVYWKRSRLNIIRRAVHERAVGDPGFVAKLLATGEHELALDGDEPGLGRPENGWGRALVEMRARLGQIDVATLRRWKLPPWLRHPEIARGSIGWRMGYGEAYWYDEWYPWLTALDAAEKARVEAVYPDWPAD
jgi:predicted NAD-dependent protein-ADP-ribosyltransferase YbiA (DUF1768 family)